MQGAGGSGDNQGFEGLGKTPGEDVRPLLHRVLDLVVCCPHSPVLLFAVERHWARCVFGGFYLTIFVVL